MNKLLRAAFIICVVAAAGSTVAGAAQDAGEGWFDYRSDNFSISFPAKPSAGSMALKKDSDTYSGIALGLERKGAAYILTCIELEGAPFLSLDDLPDVLRSREEGRVLNKRAISLQGYDGREYTIRNAKGTLIHRTYIVNKWIYQLAVQTRRVKIERRHIDRFFESFRIVPPSATQIASRPGRVLLDSKPS